MNSKGYVFVFTRSNSAGGAAFAPSAARLLEFRPNGEFLGEIGKGLCAWSFAPYRARRQGRQILRAQ